MRRYVWPVRGRPIRLLLLAWGLSYDGDLAAFTAASVYVYHVGGAAYVGLLGLLKALLGVLLVPLVASWSDRVRRERLLAASVALRAFLLAAAAAVMTGGTAAILVLVLVGVEAGLGSAFRQVQAALLPWLARTPDELTRANTAVGVVQSAAMLGGPADGWPSAPWTDRRPIATPNSCQCQVHRALLFAGKGAMRGRIHAADRC